MTGKLRPRFRSPLSDVEMAEAAAPEPLEIPVGTPMCPRCGSPGEKADEFCRTCGMVMAGAPRWGIDGPTDGVWVTPGPHGRLVYKPLGVRSTAWRLVVKLTIVAAVGAAAAHLAYLANLNAFLPDVPVTDDVITAWIERLDVISALLLVLVCVVGAWWTSRAYGNLVPMQVRGMRVPLTLARVCWLIPVVNLWLTKLVIDDLWRASDPSVGYRSTGWRRRPIPIASNVGWIGVLGAVLLIPYAYLLRPDRWVDDPSTASRLRFALLTATAGYVLLVMGLGVLHGLVGQITDKQRARVDRLGTSPHPKPFDDAAAEDVEPPDPAAGALKRDVSPEGPVWGRY